MLYIMYHLLNGMVRKNAAPLYSFEKVSISVRLQASDLKNMNLLHLEKIHITKHSAVKDRHKYNT